MQTNKQAIDHSIESAVVRTQEVEERLHDN